MVKSKDNGDAAPGASHLKNDHNTIFTLQLEPETIRKRAYVFPVRCHKRAAKPVTVVTYPDRYIIFGAKTDIRE